MAKSAGSFITLDSLIQNGFNPLSYRYLCLTAHYRSKLAFSWESLAATQNALKKLTEKVTESRTLLLTECGTLTTLTAGAKEYRRKFLHFINDDLDMPKAVALMWQMLDDKKLTARAKYALLLDFDKVFGLGLAKIKKQKIPKNILELVKQREEYRQQKQWQKADEIRKEVEGLGYEIEDTKKGLK